MLGLLRHDELISLRLCFAKKAVAFFNISRSSCRMRFSLRSRASSSRSAVVNAPDLPLPRSTRVCSTHLRNDDSVKSRSRASAPTVFPSSSTSRTAPALNSSLKLRRVRLGCLSAVVDIVEHTIIEAAEQALPKSRARAGGWVLPQTPWHLPSNDPQSWWLRGRGADGSYAPPIRAGAMHRSPETSFVKP